LIEHKFIVPECYGDTALVECLGYKNPNHKHGIGNVFNALEEKGLRDSKAICIVDNDKAKSAKKKFASLLKLKTEGGLSLYQNPGSKHHIIVIEPALEKWILNCTQLVSISPSEFGLPGDFDGFKSYIKTKNVDEKEPFIRFMRALRKASPQPMEILGSWIKELSEN